MVGSLIEEKMFRKFRFLGKLHFVAVDATGRATFEQKHCDHCLTKTSKREWSFIFIIFRRPELSLIQGFLLKVTSIKRSVAGQIKPPQRYPIPGKREESEKYRKEVHSNRLYIINLNFWQQITAKRYCFEFGQLHIEDNIKIMFIMNRCHLLERFRFTRNNFK